MDDLLRRLARERARSEDLARRGVRLRLQSALTVLRSEDLVLSSQVDRYLRVNTPTWPGAVAALRSRES